MKSLFMFHDFPLAIRKIIHLKLIVVFFMLAASVIAGCGDDNPSEPEVQAINEDLFPLVIGRQLVYNGYLRDPGTDQNNTSFTAYQAKWTVASNAIPSPTGGTANLILDSTFAPVGWVATPIIIKRNSPTGNGDMSVLQSIGSLYRTIGISSADSLKWMDLRFDKGFDTDFTAFDTTLTLQQGTVRLHCVSRLKPNVSVTVNGQTYNTYELSTKAAAYVNGNLYEEKPFATFWFAPNIGPVKMIINAKGDTPGHYRELVSKNF
ncbi:MAG: hypothetical protein R6W90_06565 [Ignavibacteriaceae bacterium]